MKRQLGSSATALRVDRNGNIIPSPYKNFKFTWDEIKNQRLKITRDIDFEKAAELIKSDLTIRIYSEIGPLNNHEREASIAEIIEIENRFSENEIKTNFRTRRNHLLKRLCRADPIEDIWVGPMNGRYYTAISKFDGFTQLRIITTRRAKTKEITKYKKMFVKMFLSHPIPI